MTATPTTIPIFFVIFLLKNSALSGGISAGGEDDEGGDTSDVKPCDGASPSGIELCIATNPSNVKSCDGDPFNYFLNYILKMK